MSASPSTTPRANYYAIPALIEARKDFKGNTMSGRAVRPGSHHSAGELNEHERIIFFGNTDYIDYIVWSYATPIAWHIQTPDGRGIWYRVEQHFSTTTSKHQGKCPVTGTRS